MPTLRHRFSNERWGGGGALNHLPLLFCKSVYNGRQVAATCCRSSKDQPYFLCSKYRDCG